MSWINTHTGKSFSLQVFQPQRIDVNDIAHALSQICRYTGHTDRFYSVAEHCCRVFDVIKEMPNHSANDLLCALMHDASEAYLGDVSAPLKSLPEMEGYRTVEARLEGAIAIRFGLMRVNNRWPSVVEYVDKQMLTVEVEALLANKHPDFDLPKVSDVVREVNARRVFGWSSREAKTEFSARWNGMLA